MPKCTDGRLHFGRVGRREIEAAFDGGDIVSDGGVMLIRQVDQRLGVTQAAARVFDDKRRATSVKHSIAELIAQRVYGLCCGWEDVTDHNTRCGTTWCCKRQWAAAKSWHPRRRSAAWRTRPRARMQHALHKVLLDQFIASR